MGYSERGLGIFLKLWPFTHMVKKLSAYTPFRQIFAPLIKDSIFDVTFVPVSESIPVPEDTALPSQAIAELIKASSHRFINNVCICRTQEHCVNYPRDLGCIFLGEAASRMHPSLGHRASVEECLKHLEKASKLGLTGMVGRIWFDATALGLLHDFRHFLVICFCCDCCCLVRKGLKNAGPEFKGAIKKLDGVRVSVGDGCVGCGTCAETCFVRAITLVDGRSHIDQDLCKGCGRCATVCPQGAIHLDFDPGDAIFRELLSRVGKVIE
jgi:ferredoxin